ncbi:MAG: helix-turn-helix transcriptional regulator [Pseudonocardia sp.]
MLAQARQRAGISQDELAKRAGTSRPTLSAYEHGHRSPTLRTASRILAAAGFELTACASGVHRAPHPEGTDRRRESPRV